MTKNSEWKELLRLNKKHFSSFIKDFQLSKIVSDLRVHLYGKNKCYDSLNNKSIEKRLRRNESVKFNDNMKTGQILTLQIPINPSRPNLGWREKINLIFYFYTSLWYLKKFYEGVKGLHKTFWGTTKKCKNKNLS